MKKLTLKEEFEYLKRCKGKPLGAGSSRIVYNLGGNVVCKIAISSEGLAQNQREVDCYSSYNIDKSVLAEIYAYGMYVVIMEKVKELWDFGSKNTLLAKFGYDMCDIREVLRILGEEVGETGDNEQLGINSVGKIVCFDYGFDIEEEQDSQVGSCYAWVSPEGVVEDENCEYVTVPYKIRNILIGKDKFKDFENNLKRN